MTVINGFHEHVKVKHLIYNAITRVSDLIILVGMETQLLEIFGEKHLKNRETSRIELIAPVNTIFSI